MNDLISGRLLNLAESAAKKMMLRHDA